MYRCCLGGGCCLTNTHQITVTRNNRLNFYLDGNSFTTDGKSWKKNSNANTRKGVAICCYCCCNVNAGFLPLYKTVMRIQFHSIFPVCFQTKKTVYTQSAWCTRDLVEKCSHHGKLDKIPLTTIFHEHKMEKLSLLPRLR